MRVIFCIVVIEMHPSWNTDCLRAFCDVTDEEDTAIAIRIMYTINWACFFGVAY